MIGVLQQNSDNANYAPIIVEGIAQCRFLTGVAINFGDVVKVGDNAGRVTKGVPAAPGANVRGQVGVAMQSLAAGVADRYADRRAARAWRVQRIGRTDRK